MPARDAEAARACQPRKRKAAPLELEGPAVVTKRRALPSVGKHKPEPGEPASAAGLYHGSTSSGRQQVELSGPIMANRCLMGRAALGGFLQKQTTTQQPVERAPDGPAGRQATRAEDAGPPISQPAARAPDQRLKEHQMSDDTFTANVNEVSSSSPHPCTTSSPRRKCWSAWRNVCRNRWPGPPCRRTPSRPSSVPSPAVWLMSDQSFPRRLRRQSREGGAAHRHRGRQQPAGVPDRDAKEALAVRRRPFRAGQQDPSGTSTRSATSLYVILSHDLISVLTNGPKPAAVLDNLLNVVGVDPFCGSGALLHARSRDGCGGVARHADPRHRAADRASRRVTVQLKLGDTQLSAKEPRCR